MVTPASTPRVADEHVVLATLGSVANSGDTVVEVGTASSAGENSRFVSLEDRLVSLDGDRHDSLGDGGVELARAVSGHALQAGSLDGATLLGLVAVSGLSFA